MIPFGGSNGKRTLREQNVMGLWIGLEGTLKMFQHCAGDRVLAPIESCCNPSTPSRAQGLPGGVTVPKRTSQGEPVPLGATLGWAGQEPQGLSAAGAGSAPWWVTH